MHAASWRNNKINNNPEPNYGADDLAGRRGQISKGKYPVTVPPPPPPLLRVPELAISANLA